MNPRPRSRGAGPSIPMPREGWIPVPFPAPVGQGFLESSFTIRSDDFVPVAHKAGLNSSLPVPRITNILSNIGFHRRNYLFHECSGVERSPGCRMKSHHRLDRQLKVSDGTVRPRSEKGNTHATGSLTRW